MAREGTSENSLTRSTKSWPASARILLGLGRALLPALLRGGLEHDLPEGHGARARELLDVLLVVGADLVGRDTDRVHDLRLDDVVRGLAPQELVLEVCPRHPVLFEKRVELLLARDLLPLHEAAHDVVLDRVEVVEPLGLL
jgi:hypothetical protein